MSLLDVHELCFSWPGRDVLRDINFEIKRNELVLSLIHISEPTRP